jgi:hypothetical protein
MLPKHARCQLRHIPLVSVGRLELPASCTPSMRSTNLSYTLLCRSRAAGRQAPLTRVGTASRNVGLAPLAGKCLNVGRRPRSPSLRELGRTMRLELTWHAVTAHGLDSSPLSAISAHVWNRTSIGRLSSGCTKTIVLHGPAFLRRPPHQPSSDNYYASRRTLAGIGGAARAGNPGRRGGSRTRMLLVPNQAAYQQAFTPLLKRRSKEEIRRRDSNPQHPDPKSGAATSCATPE